MDKKKVIKIVLIILAIIISLVLIHTIRNFCILTSIANAQEKFKDYTNYSFTVESYGVRENEATISFDSVEYFMKDNIRKETYIRNNTPRLILWRNNDTKELIQVSENEKKATVSKVENKTDVVGDIIRELIITGDDFSTRLHFSFISFISYAKVDNEKCYLLNNYTSNNFYVSKKNKLLMRSIAGQYLIDDKLYNSITDIKNLRINEVTDSDVARPDLTGYTIVEK